MAGLARRQTTGLIAQPGGALRNTALSQWFTPPDVAQLVVDWAGVARGIVPAGWNPSDKRTMRVLEPAAGDGALVRPLLAAGAEVHAFEVDARYAQSLRALGCEVYSPRDFLKLEDWPWTYDLCVMNPPYEGGLDAAFVLHALKLAPRVVGLFRSAIVHGDERYETLWRWVDVARGKWLRKRPLFGVGRKSKSARSDYVLLELVARALPRKHGDEMTLTFGWL